MHAMKMGKRQELQEEVQRFTARVHQLAGMLDALLEAGIKIERLNRAQKPMPPEGFVAWVLDEDGRHALRVAGKDGWYDGEGNRRTSFSFNLWDHWWPCNLRPPSEWPQETLGIVVCGAYFFVHVCKDSPVKPDHLIVTGEDYLPHLRTDG